MSDLSEIVSRRDDLHLRYLCRKWTAYLVSSLEPVS